MPETREDPASPDTLSRWREATRYTRGLVLAEALVAIMLGFTADDLGLLRVPGYLAGLGIAFVALSFGGLFHGARLSHRLTVVPPDEEEEHLQRYRARGRLAAVVAAIVFLVWLVFFSQGVAPWSI